MYSGYDGIQVWTVPKSGLYQFAIAGASPDPAPKAAVVTGMYKLARGQKLLLLVGQPGTLSAAGTYGGSGGTFVAYPGSTGVGGISSATCIMAAGGTGGYDTVAPDAASANATTTTDGGSPGMSGGTPTAGFTGGLAYRQNGYGGGGAGFLDDGQDANLTNSGANAGDGGKSFLNGGAGAPKGWGTSPDGGFGGGGSGGLPENRLAGGGGYCGGGGAGNGASYAGGGGGSFGGTIAVTNGGAGYITITAL